VTLVWVKRVWRCVHRECDPTWLILVFKLAADFGDRLAEVVG